MGEPTAKFTLLPRDILHALAMHTAAHLDASSVKKFLWQRLRSQILLAFAFGLSVYGLAALVGDLRQGTLQSGALFAAVVVFTAYILISVRSLFSSRADSLRVQYVTALSASPKPIGFGTVGEVEIGVSEAGVTYSDASGSSVFPWSGVDSVVETDELLSVYMHNDRVLVVPLRCFWEDDDKDKFVQRLRELSSAAESGSDAIAAYAAAIALPCPDCSYDLAGTRTAVCPECGHQLTPSELKPKANAMQMMVDEAIQAAFERHAKR